METKKFLFPTKFAKDVIQSASSKAIEDRYKQSNIEDNIKKAEQEKGRPLTQEETKEIIQKSKISQGEITRLKREASSTESVASINSNTRERNLVSFHKMNNALISILDSNITSKGDNCQEGTKPAVRTNIPELVPSPPPPYKEIDRFPFPPHLFQEFNSTNDEDLLFKENVMLVKKTRKSIITGEYIYESTRCLATGEGCVNYQKDISELLKIPISNIKLDTTSVISKSAIQEAFNIIALGITLGSLEPFDDGVLVVDPGTYARAAMDGCSSWWKRADYRW